MRLTWLYTVLIVAVCATVAIYIWASGSAPKVERSFQLKIDAPRD
jgi:hypothetical protein